MSIMLAQMGLSIASTASNYFQASAEHKVSSRMQKFRNTMNELSAARQMNAVEVNRVRTDEAGFLADLMLQKQAMQDQAEVENNAAAAGVAGGSVDMVMNDLKASASLASYAQKRKLHDQRTEFKEMKRTIRVNAIMGKDVQVIPKPSAGAALLGVGTNLLDIYDSHQPQR